MQLTFWKSKQNERLITEQIARLFHLQSRTPVVLPLNKSIFRIGKQNEQTTPDIDVSGFQNSEFVSRIHADIRRDGDVYFLEDKGSANGTYLNQTLLKPGNRYRLNVGDRIALGKGDLVVFVFALI